MSDSSDRGRKWEEKGKLFKRLRERERAREEERKIPQEKKEFVWKEEKELEMSWMRREIIKNKKNRTEKGRKVTSTFASFPSLSFSLFFFYPFPPLGWLFALVKHDLLMYQEATFRWQFMSLLFLPLILSNSLLTLTLSSSSSHYFPSSSVTSCDCHLIFTTISERNTTRIPFIPSHIFCIQSWCSDRKKERKNVSYFFQPFFRNTLFASPDFCLMIQSSLSPSLAFFSLNFSLYFFSFSSSLFLSPPLANLLGKHVKRSEEVTSGFYSRAVFPFGQSTFQ